MFLRLFMLSSILVLASPAFSADYKYFKYENYNISTLSGDIGSNEYNRFFKFINDHKDTNAILLQSSGGSVSESIKIGKEIRRRKFDLGVETYCISSCVFIFLSGRNVFAYDGAYLAIHKPYFKYKSGVVEDKENSKTYSEIYNYLSLLNKNSHAMINLLRLIYNFPSSNLHQLEKNEIPILVKYYTTPIFS